MRSVFVGWIFVFIMVPYFLVFALLPVKWSDRIFSTKFGEKVGNLPGKLYHFAETGSWS